MKKLISLLSVAFLATSVFAIPATTKRMAIELPAPQENAAQFRQSPYVFDVQPTQMTPAQAAQTKEVKKQAMTPVRKAVMEGETEAPKALYFKPIGSFFLGMGNLATSLVPSYAEVVFDFFYPTVYGSWLNGYEYWLWPNLSQNATNVTYLILEDKEYPDDAPAGWTTDAQGNFIDSTSATSNRDFGYYSSIRVPLQIASNEAGNDMLYLIGEETTRPDTILYNARNQAGRYNKYSSDGMWPLTNAIFSTPKYGAGTSLVWDRDTIEKTVSYIYGTEPIALVVDLDTLYEADEVTIDTIIPIYDTIQPSVLQVDYQKPMSPLYIKDITVARGKIGYVVDSADWMWQDIKIDTLRLYIITKDGVVAASQATKDDTLSMANYPGQMVTFKLQRKDAYGSIIEGITLNESFSVAILGLDREGNNFGIWSGYNPYLGSMQTTVLDTAYNDYKYARFDPFIMLNGIYYTLEHALATHDLYTAPAQYQDTINISMDIEDGYYVANHADGAWKGYTPMLRAVELLYDTISKQYNYDISAPAWAGLDMDGYDEIIWEQYPSYTFWNTFSAYWIIIYGDPEDTSVDAPQVGDEIKISKYGKEIVFKVVNVEEPTAINNVVRTVNDNKRYNVLGMEVDEDYKGVVIRNGQKFLQR